jgi:uncharacterized membrane protein
MPRLLRRLVALALGLVAVAAVGGKAAWSWSGPYLEALPAFPYCGEAAAALADDRLEDAIEFGEAGGCTSEVAAAEARRSEWGAGVERCLGAAWTGSADDATGVACALASDLVVFGDVRDLARQGWAWSRGEATDPVLVALSGAGLALTFAPQVGLGNALFKVARRAGTLSASLAGDVVRLVRQGAWGAVGGLLGDAGRISARVGLAGGTRALRHADDAVELAALARFVEVAPAPLLGLRWAGKGVVRHADDGPLLRAAVVRGPEGVRLAAERGGRALLARQPVVIAVAKVAWTNPEAVARVLAALAAYLLRWATWPVVVAFGAVALAAAALIWPRRRRRGATVPGGFTWSRAVRS